MDTMYRATDPRPTRLSADERRKRDGDSKRRARRKGYASRGGLSSSLLERWWFEAVGDPMKTSLTGDQAVAFFNRVGLPREILVRVWEMAKRGRKGEPKGMTRVEFEAAACLTSVALFEYPQVIKLPGRDIARHADAHARKRIGYASAGMYWKFSAFELSPAAATTPTSSNRRVVRTATNELFSRQTQPPPSRPPTDSSSEDDDPTPRAVPRFVIRGAPPVAAAAPPPDPHDPFATIPVDDSLVPKPSEEPSPVPLPLPLPLPLPPVAPPPPPPAVVSPLPPPPPAVKVTVFTPPPPVPTHTHADTHADVDVASYGVSVARTSSTKSDFFDEAGDSFPTQLCSLGLDDSMSVRSPDARSPGLQSAFEPAWDDTEKDELADKVWNAAGLRR